MAISAGGMYWLDEPAEEVAMQMIDLILLACSLVSPASCHEYHVLFQSAGSLEACTMRAQPYLAQWVGEHPNFRIARWRCAWPEKEEENG